MSNQNLSITLLGDLMLGGQFSENFESFHDRYLPQDAFTFLQSDIVFANLEAPASNNGNPPLEKILVYTKSDPLVVLKEMGISFVNLANNHIMDYGYQAAKETMHILDNLGIKHAGCGINLNEARKPVLIKTNKHSVYFLCYSWTNEFNEPTVEATITSPGVAPIRYEFIKEDVKAIKQRDPNAKVIVSLHWGEGKSRYPRPNQIQLARSIVDLDVDMIVGHHTHCLQGYEIYKGKPILYSIGNFIASQYMKDSYKRLNYDGMGTLRIRYLRERKTAAFKVTLSKKSEVKYLPLLQKLEEPILVMPDAYTQQQIMRLLDGDKKIIQSKYYNKFFPILRRIDELTRIFEDLKDEGVRKDLIHLQTPLRIIKKLVLGKNYS